MSETTSFTIRREYCLHGFNLTVLCCAVANVLMASPRRRLGDKALLCFGPPRRFSPPRRRLSPPRRLGGGDSPQLA